MTICGAGAALVAGDCACGLQPAIEAATTVAITSDEHRTAEAAKTWLRSPLPRHKTNELRIFPLRWFVFFAILVDGRSKVTKSLY
jgi:hypothetical protein